MNEKERLILINKGIDIIGAGKDIVKDALDDDTNDILDTVDYIKTKLCIIEITFEEVK